MEPLALAVTTPTVALTGEQIERFHHDGYLALDALTTAADVLALRREYDRLFEQRAGRALGLQFDLAGTDDDDGEALLPQILDPARFAPQLNDSLLLVNASAVTRQLFGPDATCSFFHAINKPPLRGAETPWHQDASYWPPDHDHPTVSIWVPLQPVTVENGCMEFVPGSHAHGEVLAHRSIGDDPRIHGNELRPDQLVHTAGAVACPLDAGGATIHGGFMLHRTGPNRSAEPRRALILSGGLPAVRRTVPRHLPWQADKRTARARRAEG